ncbi:hypothetical protein AAG906_021843 [Vitis piasezkii]
MDGTTADGQSPAQKRMSSRVPATIQGLAHDVLCMIFVLLDLFDLVRCSAVCQSWNKVINKSKLLQILYHKQQGGSIGPSSTSHCSEKPLKVCIEQLAMEHHRLSLQGLIDIEQWKGHSVRAGKCRMKMGLILTGVGDKAVCLWSLESYKCLEEHFLPNLAPLVDFDFDENKAVVGCEDGTARVFDMYSRKCSRIIRMHSGPVRCLALSDDQCIISGSSLGSITISGLSSDQQIAKLRHKNLVLQPRSHLVFSGSTAGYASCWDLRTMRPLWENRISPNVIYSMQHLCSDTHTLVAGGIDGVLRILDQNTGKVVSGCVMDDSPAPTSSQKTDSIIERKKGRRITEDTLIDSIPKSSRPPITCLAVGMQKVVTTHNGKYIRMWKFHKDQTLQA